LFLSRDNRVLALSRGAAGREESPAVYFVLQECTLAHFARKWSSKPNAKQNVIQNSTPPRFIEPQLCKLVEKAPTGDAWVHEAKYDGYRMAAQIDRDKVQLLTRSGLDWTDKYPETAAALATLPVKTAYLDGELCGVGSDGVTSFELMQQATDSGTGALVYFAFDLLEIDGEDIAKLPLLERKARLAELLKMPPAGVAYSEHVIGDGEVFRKAACGHRLEGIVSKRSDRPYLPGDRGVWVKSKCLNRAEFVIVGWSDPEGSRSGIGALLLGYYQPDGRLLYAGRVGTGMSVKTLDMLHATLKPLVIPKMPLAVAPPRKTRFGGPFALSKVHWVKPTLVCEITYLTWSEDGLLRHTVFVGLREDKPAREVRREAVLSRVRFGRSDEIDRIRLIGHLRGSPITAA
jgi:bifunctional non-homologous end joining protein LigD